MNNSHMKDFYDIFGVWHEPWWQRTAFKGFIISLISLIGLWLIYVVLKKIFTRKKYKPCWEIALAYLGNLSAQNILVSGKAKTFYFQLTGILKQYITERYGVAVLGSTEKEILAYLEEQVNFPKESLPLLRDIFDHARSIKFANEAALKEQIEQDLALGVRLVRETIPLNK